MGITMVSVNLPHKAFVGRQTHARRQARLYLSRHLWVRLTGDLLYYPLQLGVWGGLPASLVDILLNDAPQVVYRPNLRRTWPVHVTRYYGHPSLL